MLLRVPTVANGVPVGALGRAEDRACRRWDRADIGQMDADGAAGHSSARRGVIPLPRSLPAAAKRE